MIDTIHIINLDPDDVLEGMFKHDRDKAKISRQERALNVIKQSKEHGFNVRFWPGIISNKFSYQNINAAFKKIVRWAKEKQLSTITIGEDDLMFTAPGAWDFYLAQLPAQFDIYLGGVYSAEIAGNRILNGYSGHTLITVHENFYDFFLSCNDNDHLDRCLGNFAHEKLFILCQPFVVKQMGVFSDNLRRVPDYSVFHQDFKYFGEGL